MSNNLNKIKLAKQALAANLSLFATFKLYKQTLKTTAFAWEFPWAAEKKLTQKEIKVQ